MIWIQQERMEFMIQILKKNFFNNFSHHQETAQDKERGFGPYLLNKQTQIRCLQELQTPILVTIGP